MRKKNKPYVPSADDLLLEELGLSKEQLRDAYCEYVRSVSQMQYGWPPTPYDKWEKPHIAEKLAELVETWNIRPTAIFDMVREGKMDELHDLELGGVQDQLLYLREQNWYLPEFIRSLKQHARHSSAGVSKDG